MITDQCGNMLGIPTPTSIASVAYSNTTNTLFGLPIIGFDLNPWHATLDRVLVYIVLETQWIARATPFLDFNEHLLVSIDDGITYGYYYYEAHKKTVYPDRLSYWKHSKTLIVPPHPIPISAGTRCRFVVQNFTYQEIDGIQGRYYYIPL